MYKELIDKYDWNEINACIYKKTSKEVEQALHKNKQLNVDDFISLISPAATPFIEQMAVLSRRYTQQRFGKTIQFYIPLYLSNSCVNHCIYCGFNHHNQFKRTILTD